MTDLFSVCISQLKFQPTSSFLLNSSDFGQTLWENYEKKI